MFAENQIALKVTHIRTDNLVEYKLPPKVTIFKINFFLSIFLGGGVWIIELNKSNMRV